MLVRTLATAAVVVFLSVPALAGQCPNMVGQIDAALASTPGLSDDVKAQITALRNEGEDLHNAGDHQASVDTLGQALNLLGQ
jgi:hypothetical protein